MLVFLEGIECIITSPHATISSQVLGNSLLRGSQVEYLGLRGWLPSRHGARAWCLVGDGWIDESVTISPVVAGDPGIWAWQRRPR